MEKELKGKVVKVYKNVRTKFGYEGDGRIEKVNKQISNELYCVDISFIDDYFTSTIDINDVLF
jgi:hypothetical protein